MGPVAILVAVLAGAGGEDKSVAPAPAPPPPPPPTIVVARPPPTPAPSPAAGGAAMPQPINPGSWITQADYPAAARRVGAEGTVGIRLDIDAGGRPTECLVTSSSGNRDLDMAACRIMAARGRFNPARNAGGTAIPGSFVTRVRWTLRGDPPAVPKPGQMVITFTVAPDGSVSDCTYVAEGGAAAAADPCATIPKFAPQPAVGEARARRVRMTNRIEYLEGR